MSDVSIGLVCRSPVRPSEVFAEGLGFQHYRGPHVRQFAEIVGRLEIRRAQLQVESFHYAPFRFVQWVHSSTMTNVSASPPFIPDGRVWLPAPIYGMAAYPIRGTDIHRTGCIPLEYGLDSNSFYRRGGTILLC